VSGFDEKSGQRLPVDKYSCNVRPDYIARLQISQSWGYTLAARPINLPPPPMTPQTPLWIFTFRLPYMMKTKPAHNRPLTK